MTDYYRALVCFTDDGAHPLKFMLERGFRHCFVAVLSKGYWIELNRDYGAFQIKVQAGPDFDLKRFYEGYGYIVIETHQKIPEISCYNIWHGQISWSLIVLG